MLEQVEGGQEDLVHTILPIHIFFPLDKAGSFITTRSRQE